MNIEHLAKRFNLSEVEYMRIEINAIQRAIDDCDPRRKLKLDHLEDLLLEFEEKYKNRYGHYYLPYS